MGNKGCLTGISNHHTQDGIYGFLESSFPFLLRTLPPPADRTQHFLLLCLIFVTIETEARREKQRCKYRAGSQMWGREKCQEDETNKWKGRGKEGVHVGQGPQTLDSSICARNKRLKPGIWERQRTWELWQETGVCELGKGQSIAGRWEKCRVDSGFSFTFFQFPKLQHLWV